VGYKNVADMMGLSSIV